MIGLAADPLTPERLHRSEGVPMSRLLSKLFRRTRTTKGTPVRRPRLGIEALDARLLPAIVTGPVAYPITSPLPPVSLSAFGVLSIQGSDADDEATVSVQDSQVRVTLGHYDHYTVGGQFGSPIVNTFYTLDQEKYFNLSQVSRISFNGKAGDDQFSNLTAIPSSATGGDGDDSLIGGSGDDQLSGGTGNDTLEGRGGDDDLIGGANSDTFVFAGLNLGSDTVTEGANLDDDVLDFSNFGPASVPFGTTIPNGVTINLAAAEPQVIQAQNGVTNLRLTLSGGAGIEHALGSRFDDTIKGNGRNNRLEGNSGNDALYGGYGADTLIGGAGRDSLFAGAGADSLDGGSGNDYIVTVGGGTDAVTPGTGTDSLWVDAGNGDILNGTTGDNVHRIDAFADYNFNVIFGIVTQPVSKELDGQALADPLADQPGYTLVNYSDRPLFGPAGPQVTDVDQNALGDCYFLAKLGALAKANPEYVRQLVADLGDGTYAVRFHNEAGGEVYIRVDADLWTNSAGKPAYAGLGQQNTLWAAIVEKAWAFYRRNIGSYDTIDNHNTAGISVFTALGVDFTKFDTETFANGAAYLSAIKTALDAGKGVWLGAVGGLSNDTPMRMDDPTTDENESTYRRGAHIYTVDAVLTDAAGNPTGIRLYDPHGSFRTITNLDVIYFCSGGFAYFNF